MSVFSSGVVTRERPALQEDAAGGGWVTIKILIGEFRTLEKRVNVRHHDIILNNHQPREAYGKN